MSHPPSIEQRSIDRRAKDPWREKIEAAIDKNNADTAETKAKVEEVHEVLVSIKGALHVFGWIAAVAKWLTIMIGAVVAALGIYTAAKGVASPITGLEIPKK